MGKSIKNKVGVQGKILLSCLGIILCALFLQTLVFQYQCSKLIYKQTLEISENAMNNMKEEMTNTFDILQNLMMQIYDYREYLSEISKPYDYKKLRLKYLDLAHNFANDTFDTSYGLRTLFLYSADNRLISRYKHASSGRISYPIDIYKEDEENNVQAVKKYLNSDNDNIMISSYYNESQKRELLRIAMKIYTNNGKTCTGYMVCDFEETFLGKIMEKYLLFNEQAMWIQPVGDRPTAVHDTMLKEKEKYYKQAIDDTYKGLDLEGERYSFDHMMLFSVDSSKYNLRMISLVPEALLKESQKVMTQDLLITAVLVTGLFICVSVGMSRWISKPIVYMTGMMRRISRGEKKLRLDIYTKDEFGELGNTVNEMLDQIEKLNYQEYTSKVLLNEARYKALQAQVNPHFLYNTLDTMGAIAKAKQCGEITTMCRALSNIFRYSLGMKEMLVSLEEELRYVKNYMYIMNIRFQNEIDFRINVEAQLLQKKIPKISLQPLIENSILHGLKDKPDNKMIILRSEHKENFVVISVFDNGSGVDVKAMNRKLQIKGPDMLNQDVAVGVANIHHRIQLLFGEKYGIRFVENVDSGTLAEILLPENSDIKVLNDSERD